MQKSLLSMTFEKKMTNFDVLYLFSLKNLLKFL